MKGENNMNMKTKTKKNKVSKDIKMNKLNNKELLKLLKNNVEAFNDYRKRFPNQKIDFSGADCDQEWADLEGHIIVGANVQGINFGRD